MEPYPQHISFILFYNWVGLFKMGNTCCQQPQRLTSDQWDSIPVQVKVLQSQSAAFYDRDFELAFDAHMQKMISSKNPLKEQIEKLKDTFKSKKFANGSRYLGQLDSLGRPHGLGKLLKEDNSILIARFNGGVVDGPFLFASQNEDICHGEVVNGAVECQEGCLQTHECKYSGGFSKGLFEGNGNFMTKDSKFQGVFRQGKKKQGKLSWSDGQHTYFYNGAFDQNEKFTGKGILSVKQARLIQPFGEYDGQFLDGEKHGIGRYTFSSQLAYEGQYKHGQREGKGKLINKDGSLSYEGSFSRGLPNGQGKSFKDGKMQQESKFIDGIPEQLL